MREEKSWQELGEISAQRDSVVNKMATVSRSSKLGLGGLTEYYCKEQL